MKQTMVLVVILMFSGFLPPNLIAQSETRMIYVYSTYYEVEGVEHTG